MTHLPTGLTTFLFTDIESSTRLWEQDAEAMRLALARHDALAEAVIREHGGTLVRPRGEGDSLFIVFARATDAVSGACALQRAFLKEAWPGGLLLRARMALHVGESELRDGDYYGSAVNRCARVRSLAHGGQVLLTRTVHDLVQDHLPEGISVRDLGPHRLRELERAEHLFQLLHPDLPADFPPLRSPITLSNNLPQQFTSFVGREREMGEVKRLLQTTRLLTLTGPGGTGKTRLALQATAEWLEAEAASGAGDASAWLVELAPLSDPALVAQAAALALGVREEAGRPLLRTLAEALRSRRLLLLLDNCEHVLLASAELADTLLKSCPGVTVLATSREALGITGETVYRLPSLSLPPLPRRRNGASRGRPASEDPRSLTQYEAVRLFIDRAVAASPSFVVTNENAPAVAQICHRLDGIPLAIELAAARVKALPVEQLVQRLDDQFRILTGGSRTALPRQQTLRALIDWSYDLLSEEERRLLRTLSVFAGGWTLEAAESICKDEGGRMKDEQGTPKPGSLHPSSFMPHPSDVLDLLTGLVDKSLVLYEEQGGEARYRLQETVRQYGRDRLNEAGETSAARTRHLAYFLRFAQEAEPQLRGPAPEVWLERLEAEHDNLRTALEWCRIDPACVETGLALVAALWRFWHIRGYYTEGREQLAGALARSGGVRSATRARVLNAAGLLAMHQGALGEAETYYQAGLDLAREVGDVAITSATLGNLGLVAHEHGDYAVARQRYEESLAIDRETGNERAMANSLVFLGDLSFAQGEYDRARDLYEQSLRIRRQLNDKWAVSGSLNNLGKVALQQGQDAEARAFYEESLAIYRQLGERRGLCAPLNSLAILALREGDRAKALRYYTESLTTARDLGLRSHIAACLEGLAGLAIVLHLEERAARLLGAALSIRESVGVRLPPPVSDEVRRDREAARSALGEEAFSRAWEEGRAWSVDRVVGYALGEEEPASLAGVLAPRS